MFRHDTMSHDTNRQLKLSGVCRRVERHYQIHPDIQSVAHMFSLILGHNGSGLCVLEGFYCYVGDFD